MHRFSTISVFLLLGTASASAQNLTSGAVYMAYMDSLSREYSSLIDEWNATIPPHNIKAMRLEEEAEAHPELRDSLLAIATEDTADRLILNAQIDASEGNHKAWVGISKTSTIAKLDDATLVCSVNGKEVSQGAFDEPLSRNAVQSCFLFDAELHPGDIVRLTARGSGLSAYAEVTVPDTTGRLMAVDTLSNDSTMHFLFSATGHLNRQYNGLVFIRRKMLTDL